MDYRAYLKERIEIAKVSREEMEKDGWTEARIDKFIAVMEAPKGLKKIVAQHFPEIANSSHLLDTLKLYDFSKEVAEWALTLCEFEVCCRYLADKIAGRLRNHLVRLDNEKSQIKELTKHALIMADDEIEGLKRELAKAAARNGIYATQDKHDLENARKHIDDLKAQMAGMHITMKGQTDLIRGQEVATNQEQHLRIAARIHTQTALERLQDKHPVPGPFMGAIIGELQNAINLLH